METDKDGEGSEREREKRERARGTERENENIQDINSAKPKGSKVKVQLLGEYSPQNERIIRDPYYDGGDEGFRKVYEQCLQCCNAFLDENS
ncbi:Uncharacterised protein r2_g1900 [Pycnogonum litorale]